MDLRNADRPTLERMLASGMFGRSGEARIRARLAELEQDRTPAAVAPPRKGKRRGEMNQTEARFVAEILEPMQAKGEIVGFEYEPMTFRIPGIGRYTPDFVARYPDRRIRAFEVKNRQIWEKDRLRYKVAARERPWIWWTLVQLDRGTWKTLIDQPPTEDVRGGSEAPA